LAISDHEEVEGLGVPPRTHPSPPYVREIRLKSRKCATLNKAVRPLTAVPLPGLILLPDFLVTVPLLDRF